MDEIEQEFRKLHVEKYGFSDNAVDVLFSICLIRSFSKGETISEIGKRNNSDYFQVKGILREYILNEEGEEITLNFYRESIVTPNHFRTNKGNSIVAIQALTDCTIAEISSDKLLELRRRNKDVFSATTRFMADLFKEKINTQIIHISQPAIKRLEYFRQKFPGLENLIPNSYIASYLGITNVTLSRLRNNKNR